MAGSESRLVIFAALAGNGLIAATKFAAATYTGSSAMFSEAIHSLVDTGNQGLLLLGLHRARKPADRRHPFGYGMEIYFWAFVVAILIFAVGAGVSIYEGVSKLLEPHPVENVWVNYLVLGLAMVFEGVAWWIAFRQFRATKGGRGFLDAIQVSKDPTIFTVLLEDSAALLGLVTAFLALLGAQFLGLEWLDGAASLAIGAILAGAALLLALETKGLLIGEAADPAVIEAIRRRVASQPEIAVVHEVLTVHFGPHDILLNLSVEFRDRIATDAIEAAIDRLESLLRRDHPDIRRIFVKAQSAHSFRRERRRGEGPPA